MAAEAAAEAYATSDENNLVAADNTYTAYAVVDNEYYYLVSIVVSSNAVSSVTVTTKTEVDSSYSNEYSWKETTNQTTYSSVTIYYAS